MGDSLKVGDRVKILSFEARGTGVIAEVVDEDRYFVRHDSWHEGHGYKRKFWYYEGADLLLIEGVEEQQHVLPTDPTARKAIPVVAGCLDYFPAAIAEVSKVSKAGNEQHHPGEPLHWERGKSTDHADTIVRHLMERGSIDTDGQRHSAKVAWRALALLQEELEAAGAPKARGSR